HGLSEKDLTQLVNLGDFTDNKAITLQQVINKAKAIYESNIGYEYRSIGNKEEKRWLQERREDTAVIPSDSKKWILQ
ncbi:hypothetical protein NAI59_13050, partial [Francisella tularensis subsp. holarctica]|uniref:hypothetical protein n=1 Tax=Francisella tularensis TaxID=263 RepID=UPI002381A6AD